VDTRAVMEAHVCELWTRALQEAYSLAKGQRLNELEGRYVRRFDDSGPPSVFRGVRAGVRVRGLGPHPFPSSFLTGGVAEGGGGGRERGVPGAREVGADRCG
jgi:hypothetical protein